MSQWCYKREELEIGPITFQELSALARSGEINESARVRRVGAERWEPAWTVVGLFRDEVERTTSAPNETAPCATPMAEAPLVARVHSRFEDWLNLRGALSALVGIVSTLIVYRVSYWQSLAFPAPRRSAQESLYYFPMLGLSNAWECEILYLDTFLAGAVLAWLVIGQVQQRLVV